MRPFACHSPCSTYFLHTDGPDAAPRAMYSIRSAQAQTVRDIEIVVAGDGVTPAVREIAESFARSDPRIRFYDRPKAPLRGVANRDLAVREAAADGLRYEHGGLWLRKIDYRQPMMDAFVVVKRVCDK